MAKVHFVKKSRKDYPAFGIKKGDSYYYWSLMTGPRSSRTYKSLTRPKPSQLTISAFLSTLYGIQERIEEVKFTELEDLKSFVEEILGDIESLKDETQSSLDNMPEGLQQGDTGQLLQERIDGLENWQSELEGVDLEFEFDEEEPDEAPDEPDQQKEEPEEDYNIRYEEWKEEVAEKEVDHDEWEERKREGEKEFIQDKIEEIQSFDPGL